MDSVDKGLCWYNNCNFKVRSNVSANAGYVLPETIPGMVDRKGWGAEEPKVYPKMVKLMVPVPYVVISYFTPDITNDVLALQVIQEKHMKAGLPDIQSK